MKLGWIRAESDFFFILRGFAFAYVERVFFDPGGLTQPDTHHNCGGVRRQLMDKMSQRILVVVFTPRNDAMRIISARKANRREIKHYEHETRDN